MDLDNYCNLLTEKHTIKSLLKATSLHSDGSSWTSLLVETLHSTHVNQVKLIKAFQRSTTLV